MVDTKDRVKRSFPTSACSTIVLLGVALSGCSGSSGGGNVRPDEQPGGEPLPSLTFYAAARSVPEGGTTSLTWNATNADGCEASGGWNGGRAVSGSESVGPIQQGTVYRLSCSGPGGGVTREVEVAVGGADVSVELSASPTQLGELDNATLSWSSSGAETCSASGGWSGERPLQGSYETGPLSETTSFSLSCSNGTDNGLASVTVEVLDKMIRWQAPTRNEDGTPLTDLAGYVIYWGEESRQYVGSHRLESPDVTEWEADLAPGTYYFALTAFDSEDNESNYSNELLKIIP